jgi:hypothetical protein
MSLAVLAIAIASSYFENRSKAGSLKKTSKPQRLSPYLGTMNKTKQNVKSNLVCHAKIMSPSTRGFFLFRGSAIINVCRKIIRKSNISNINCSYLTYICFSKHKSHERDGKDGKLPWIYACNNLICIPWVMKEL